MKRLLLSLATVALGALLANTPLHAQSCSIGGHDETSENFAAGGGWSTVNMTPGTVPAGVSGSHLLISEVAPRGAGTGVASYSSEYVEIYNPTTRPVSMTNKYLADDNLYFRIVNGPYTVVNNTDWVLRFPDIVLAPGRTIVVCVTKTGFAGSGASAPAAQYVLEMRNTNGNTADDMILMTPNSTFPVTGGNFTNPSGTNGEWVALFCWEGNADLVCDIDYASFGANVASNAKLDKTGIAIDGPDAGAATSTYNPDTPAGSQTNLGSGTQLTKPLTYQRVGAESGEHPLGGNGCIGRLPAPAIDWAPVTGATGETNIRFHLRWHNPDEDAPSTPINGTLFSQDFGVFLPDYGQIGSFSVPPMNPSSFFDVFIEIPLANLPPPPDKMNNGHNLVAARPEHATPTRTNNDCPADTNWAGNVDLIWSGPGQGGQVNKHYSDIRTCIGGAPSFIHLRYNNCPSHMPWSVTGACPGFTITLVNEDLTPAPNPVPAGWTGWISIQAAASVPTGTNCCFGIVFTCGNSTGTIDVCAMACVCQPVPPTLSSVDWTVNGTTVTFHQHWENTDPAQASDPVSGTMNSQAFGVFLPDYGPIGTFQVPPIQPSSFFDVFIDVPLSQLPPNPDTQFPGGTPPPAGSPCEPGDHWHGNVDINWNGPGGQGQYNKHYGEMPVKPGGGPTNLFVETDCLGSTGAFWTVVANCPGFSVTLLNTDGTPAPNPVPAGWIGYISVTAAAGTPAGVQCCFRIRFVCNGVPAFIDVCARTCFWGNPQPVLASTDWTREGNNVQFHMVWANPGGSSDSDPVSGQMHSQPFGAFAPDYGDIGSFQVPPIHPGAFFDVFIDVPLSSLPDEPEEQLPGGGPPAGSSCPEDTSWSGNVDINWAGPGGSGQVGRHFTSLLVRPGSGSSHVHTLIFCSAPAGATYSFAGVCPGWHAALLNEDFTPAPNPVPPNWTGWISVAADAGVPPGSSCCFSVTFVCEGHEGTIDVCSEACLWSSGVGPNPFDRTFGIASTVPNPTSGRMNIAFTLPAQARARVDLYDLSGHRVRTLFAGEAEAGPNTIRWDGRGENGRVLRPGAYFVTLRADGRFASRKIALVR